MPTRHRPRALALAAVLGAGMLATGVTAASAATSTVDQQQLDDTGGYSYPCEDPLAQTFTAGRSGDLDRVVLPLHWSTVVDPGPLLVTIQTVDGAGTPTGDVLASGSITVMEAGLQPLQSAWVEIRLTSPAEVSAGTQYALVLQTSGECDTSDRWGWHQAASVDPYPGGMGMRGFSFAPELWLTFPGFDFAFETYVVLACDKPGHGYGDKNHLHCGPPGRA